ncbi:MAG: oligosaccharide repeat unit polymerase [Ignavibacteriaceae bacterium]|nr:oligosaccharide repeat unit polymerase [Ignavibacteriaceae bacterium]
MFKINFWEDYFRESLFILLLLSFSFFIILFNSDNEYFSASLVILLLILGCFLLIKSVSRLSAKKNYGEVFVIIGFLFWYIIPANINILANEEPISDEINLNVESNLVIIVLISIIIFILFWRISYSLFLGTEKASSSRSNTLSVPAILRISIAGIIIGLLPFIYDGGSVTQIFSAIFEGRAAEKAWLTTSNIGTEKSAYLYLINSLFYASLTIIWISVLTDSLTLRKKVIFLLIASFATLIVYFDQGTRSIFGMIVFPFIFLFIIRKWEVLKQSKIGRLKFLVTIFVIMFSAFLLFQFQLLYRLVYSRTDLQSLIFSNWLTLGGTSDFFSETLLAFSIVPAAHDYFHESVLLQFLVSPIPRFIWESKPLPELVWYYSQHRWGVDIYAIGGNTFPGIIGYYYMSWGWIGIAFIGSLFGFVSAQIDNVLKKIDFFKDIYQTGIILMFIIWLFLSFRNLSPGFLYPVLFAYGILKISSFIQTRNSSFENCPR